MRYITPKIVKTFVFSTVVYLILLAIVYGDLDEPAENVFGRAYRILIFVAPVVIVGEAVLAVLKERRKEKGGGSK